MRPGYRYTKAQVARMMTQAEARALQFKGYYLETDGTYFWLSKDAELHANFRNVGTGVWDKPAAPAKRTPQQRLESLVQKLWPDVKDLGFIPGLRDEDLVPIMANARMRSLDPAKARMTAEDIRAIAASMLTQAEAKHEDKLSKQITRHED